MSRQTKEYAKKLVAQMTVEEKMSQMLYESPAIERLNIPAYNWWNEALHGKLIWMHTMHAIRTLSLASCRQSLISG